MYYLPPSMEYGKPARGMDGFGSDTVSAGPTGLLTSLSENEAGSSAVTGASCLCPAWRSKAVKKRPTNEPMNGMMNLNRWILIAASICTPIQKHPPMHMGMIRQSTMRNLYKNSRTPIFIVVNLFNIAITPMPALRKLR